MPKMCTCSTRALCVARVSVCVCVLVCASNRGGGGGWFAWLAQCELFVRIGRVRKGGGGKQGVTGCFSQLPAGVVAVRGDQLSAPHFSLSLSPPSHSLSERLKWN